MSFDWVSRGGVRIEFCYQRIIREVSHLKEHHRWIEQSLIIIVQETLHESHEEKKISCNERRRASNEPITIVARHLT